jgi:hypothetical protein
LWTVNGQTWINVIDSDYGAPLASPAPGAFEIWEIANPSGGWFHPFHIHLVDFRIIDRNGKPPFPYELGPKDTVYVGENEAVRLPVKLRGPAGGAENPRRRPATRNTGSAWAATRCTATTWSTRPRHDEPDVGRRAARESVPRGKPSDWEDAHHPIEAAKPRSWNEDLSGYPDLEHFTGF